MENRKFCLSSPDIQEGHFMAKTFEFNGFGCDGPNLSPALHWQDAPAAKKLNYCLARHTSVSLGHHLLVVKISTNETRASFFD